MAAPAPTAAADTAAPPPPPLAPGPAAMAAPTVADDTAALPPPPLAAEPAAEVSRTPPPMATPTATADTVVPPPPPPASEPAAKVSHTPHMAAAAAAADPPPPPPAPVPAAKVSHTLPPQPDAPAPKKRKLEEAGFHTSAYYKIRTAVADLRLRFVQVYESTDFRNSDAAREILKEIKIVMDLSKKMRLDLTAASEPVKPSEKPLAGAVKDVPTEPIPSGERNQVPHTGQAAIPPNNANDGGPPKPDK